MYIIYQYLVFTLASQTSESPLVCQSVSYFNNSSFISYKINVHYESFMSFFCFVPVSFALQWRRGLSMPCVWPVRATKPLWPAGSPASRRPTPSWARSPQSSASIPGPRSSRIPWNPSVLRGQTPKRNTEWNLTVSQRRSIWVARE